MRNYEYVSNEWEKIRKPQKRNRKSQQRNTWPKEEPNGNLELKKIPWPK